MQGIQVSSGGVRGVWQRHTLLTSMSVCSGWRKPPPTHPLGQAALPAGTVQSRVSGTHTETPHTGALVAVAIFFVGHLKGVGKLYLQTAIDCAILAA